MKKKIIDTSVVKKIEVNKHTNEPEIVDIPEAEYLNQPIQKADFVEEKSSREAKKKDIAERVFGIKEHDKNIDKRQKLFKIITTIIFIVFMGGVFVYTAYKDFFVNKNFPSKEHFKEIFSTGLLFFLLAIFSLFLGFFFKGLKNVVMCKSMTKKAHFITCMETAIIGTYYNNVTPLAVGGQPFEIYHLSKHGVHSGVATSIPIASFFMNQLAFVILGIVSLILFKQNIYGAPAFLTNLLPPAFFTLTIVGLCCCLFVPTLVIFFSLMPKIGAKLVYLVIKLGTKLRIVKKPEETLQATIKTVVHNSHCLKKLASSPFVFILITIFSFCENIANVSIAYFVLKGFGFDLGLHFITEWIIICSICFILFASITFIPTPGNSGAADLSFFVLFESVLYAGLAFPAMIVWRLFSFYSTIIIGFLYVTVRKRYDAKVAKRLQAQKESAELQAQTENDGEQIEETSQLSMDIDSLTEMVEEEIKEESNAQAID